jgi:DNA-binding winged helix-turn-helix (wHTH) protein
MNGENENQPDRELHLDKLDRVRVGDVTKRVGAIIHRALKCLVAGSGADLTTLCRAVWGDEIVRRSVLRSLVYRINRVLREMGHPARCGLEGNRVVWMPGGR